MNEYPLEAGAPPPPSAPPEPILTRIAQQYLEQTQPWVRFMSVLIFAGSGLMAIGAFVMLALVMAGGLSGRNGAALGAIGGLVLALTYFVMACLYIAPGLFLHRFAGAIRELKATGTSGALEAAMGHQKSFWRFVGILSAVGAVIGVVFVAFAVVLGALGAIIARQS